MPHDLHVDVEGFFVRPLSTQEKYIVSDDVECECEFLKASSKLFDAYLSWYGGPSKFK